MTDNPQQEEQRYATTRAHDETPTDDHKWLQMPTAETQKGGARKSKEKEALGVRNSGLEEMEACSSNSVSTLC